MRAGLVQLTVGDDPAENLPETLALIRAAVQGGAGFVLTPECTNALSSNRARQRTLFRAEDLARARGNRPATLERIVVAVDPPVTGHGKSDECGIVVVGAVTEGPPQNWHAVVLEDASVAGASPDQWARAAIAAMERHQADRLVAEVNQGGDLVQTMLAEMPGGQLGALSALGHTARVQCRWAHEVFIDAHDGARVLQRPPECGRHLQDRLRRIGLCNPGADLLVLVWRQQRQMEHLVNRLHEV